MYLHVTATEERLKSYIKLNTWQDNCRSPTTHVPKLKGVCCLPLLPNNWYWNIYEVLNDDTTIVCSIS